jgi:Tfp pilus assembly protein FimT
MVELAVVVLVIGILAAIAIPAIGVWIDEYRLETAAQQVADQLQAAKMTAVSKTRRTELLFDVPGNRLGREGQPLGELPPGVSYGAGDVRTPPDAGVPVVEAVTFPPLDGNASMRAAAFTGRGLPDVDPGKTYAVFLSNSTGTRAVVMTSAGNVRVLEWDGEAWK